MSAPRKLRVGLAEAGQRLDAFLAERTGAPLATVRATIAAGAVYVDGARERDAARTVSVNQRLTVHATADGNGPRPTATDTATAAATATATADWHVVHASPAALVISKSSGLAVTAPREGGRSLDLEVAARFPGATLVHRIDRGTSGLVLFAPNDAARRALAAALTTRTLERVYLARVAGALVGDARTIDLPIGHDPRDPRRQAPHAPDARPARTRVAPLAAAPDGSTWVRCELDTGRTHQIRVHLAAIGHPILGDARYAPPEVAARWPRLALHAHALAWPGGAAVAPWPAALGPCPPGLAPPLP